MEVSSPGLSQVAGGRKHRHRLTLAPAIMEVCTDPAGSAEAGAVAEVGEAALSEGSSDQAVLNLADDEAYSDCIMAGYSSEEAREYIFDKKKSSRFKEESLVENFWSEVGFPKGTRWWENECPSVGRQPEHRQCASSEPSSPQSSKHFSPPSKRRVTSNPDI